jgi:hypothetical protein
MFIFQVTQEYRENDYDEWQFQQQTLQAQQASREEFIRHQREVPPTPGRNLHFGDAGASSSQPPLNTQTQPEVTQHDEYERSTHRFSHTNSGVMSALQTASRIRSILDIDLVGLWTLQNH